MIMQEMYIDNFSSVALKQREQHDTGWHDIFTISRTNYFHFYVFCTTINT